MTLEQASQLITLISNNAQISCNLLSIIGALLCGLFAVQFASLLAGSLTLFFVIWQGGKL